MLLHGESPRFYKYLYSYSYIYLFPPFTDAVVYFSYFIVGDAFLYLISNVTGYAVFFSYFYLYFIIDYVDFYLFDTYNYFCRRYREPQPANSVANC